MSGSWQVISEWAISASPISLLALMLVYCATVGLLLYALFMIASASTLFSKITIGAIKNEPVTFCPTGLYLGHVGESKKPHRSQRARPGARTGHERGPVAGICTASAATTGKNRGRYCLQIRIRFSTSRRPAASH